jgi:hypothetical protein
MTKLIETIQLLIYKEDPTLLEKVDFEDDNTFLEPLLFAYFNRKKDNIFSIQMLTEIMQGYFIEKEPIVLKESYNKEGIAYIPKMGYFDKNGNKVEDILYIEDIEILKEIHPLLHPRLFEYYKGHITNRTPVYKTVWKEHINTFQNAIQLIKKHLPNFYKDFKAANFRIFIHNNPKILNFTSIETLGMLYFYATPQATMMYFIEELIHQGAHNILYHITYPKTDFFKIDASNTIMRELTHQEWDYRDVYGAFHGVYTVFKRLECYDILIQNNVMQEKDKHELLGRLADQFPRFRTGLELLPLDKVYTEKGKELYLDLDKKCEQILNKYSILVSEFDLSFRDLDFNYEDFEKYNSYEKFLENELKYTF